MPLLRQDNEQELILNMIYERQMKRVVDYFYVGDQETSYLTSMNLELFMISVSDPTVFLDYSSISLLNCTLDEIQDPDELESWILIVLDYLAFQHRILNVVNLDVKPKNIFIGEPNKYKNSDESQKISMDLGSALIIDHDEDRQYYVQVATKEYCSPKFLNAFKSQTPLSAQDLIQEDHYQILKTLDEVCKGRKDLT